MKRQVSRRRPRFDVGFLGRPNTTSVLGPDGQPMPIDQRTSWLRELRRDAPDLTFSGGLTEWAADYSQRLADEPALRELCFARNNVSFATYWRLITDCRVLLSPGGNAPWTYRHYESLYAGAAVVSIDFRRRDMLTPLPRDNMIHVSDGASIVPAVRDALALAQARPSLAEDNFAHLEQYLHYGSYAKNRRPLLERFLSQLD
jgi:hypothetical protein